MNSIVIAMEHLGIGRACAFRLVELARFVRASVKLSG
jgi:hypothetical protein